MATLLQTRNLIKDYPGVRAVDGVDLSIEQGQCLGLLGPNGAGKTTTVEIMEGVNTATSGEVLYRGKPLDRHFKNEAGIQFQSTSLQDYLTVKEVLELFSGFYPKTMAIDELAELCALTDFLDRDNKKLSGGQLQRLSLALALVNDPEIVFLDEPTTGLDPQARRNCWHLVRSILERGKTVLLTTHYMEEAYTLCDEIAIMDLGKIIAQGPPDDLLKAQFEGAVVSLPSSDFKPPDDFPWHHYRQGERIEVQTAEVNETLSYLMRSGVSLSHLTVHSRTLEDLFLELTGRSIRA